MGLGLMEAKQFVEALPKAVVEEVEKDINRPRYFDPQEAKEYGLIDKVKKQLHFHLRYICLKNSSTGTIRMKDI